MRTAAPGGTIGKRRGMKPDRSVQARLDAARTAAYTAQKTPNTKVNIADKAQRKAAEFAARRARPENSVDFGDAIKGPSGAQLASYSWQWEWGMGRNKQGDEVERRVSNWDASITNKSTNRNIVHQFTVIKNGRPQTMSAESALKELGYTGGQATKFKALKSQAQTLARYKMQEASLTQALKRQQASESAMRTPRVKTTKTRDGTVITAGQFKMTVKPERNNAINRMVDRDGSLTPLGKSSVSTRYQSFARSRSKIGNSYATTAELQTLRQKIKSQERKLSRATI